MRALSITVVLVVLGGTASADGFYFGWGYGGSDVKNELAEYFSSTFDFHAEIGMRRGAWAVEGRMTGNIAVAPVVEDGGALTDGLMTLGVDAKYIQPVSSHLEMYLRGGIRHAELSTGDYSGRGVGAGAGIQLKGKVRALGFLAWPFFFLKIGPKITAAVHLDAGYDFYRLHPGGDLGATPAIDAELTSISLGFAVGSDF